MVLDATPIAPIAPSALAAGAMRRGELRADGDGLLWLERRPNEGGRSLLVSWRPGLGARDLEAPVASIGGRVYEYGGGAYCRLDDGTLAVVDGRSQGIVAFDRGGGDPTWLLTVADGAQLAHGDLQAHGDGVLALRESSAGLHHERSIVRLGLDGNNVDLLRSSGFLAGLRVSPDGGKICWLAWDHPQMPWDGAQLWVADLTPAGLSSPRHLLGDVQGSAAQPQWTTSGEIVVAWERDGWWKPYLVDAATAASTCLWDEEVEVAPPMWVLGERSIAVDAQGEVAVVARREGRCDLALLGEGGPRILNGGLLTAESLVAHPTGFAALGSTAAADGVVVLNGEVVDGGSSLLMEGEALAARAISAAGDSGRMAHGLLTAPAGPAKALVVACHGGPTAGVDPGYQPLVAFLVSHGFAVLQAAYAGSTGFGRSYRDGLLGAWGVADVEDCRALARAATESLGLRRAFIRGGSAGGFTALNALRGDDTFAGAVSWYGVSELTALAAHTHDFEARYLDGLVAPLPGGEAIYEDRSPALHGDEIGAAVLLLQGLDDPVVPPAQSRAMAEAIERAGGEVQLIEFAGERHGFRSATALEAAYGAELEFYLRHAPSP